MTRRKVMHDYAFLGFGLELELPFQFRIAVYDGPDGFGWPPVAAGNAAKRPPW